MKRPIAITIILICLIAMTGCQKQADMGIKADDFISAFNQEAEAKGIEQATFEDYKQGEMPPDGSTWHIFEKGTKITLILNDNLNVAIITISAHPGLLKDEAAMEEYRNTATTCIDVLDKPWREDILQATGLNDIQNAVNNAMEDKGKNKLYFFDTNTKKQDTVHGKTYRLVYTDGQAKIYYDISYPLGK